MNNTFFEHSRFKAHELMEAKLEFNAHCLKFVGQFGLQAAPILDSKIKVERQALKSLWEKRFRKGFQSDTAYSTWVGESIFDKATYAVFTREEMRIIAYKLFYLKKMRRVVNKLCAQLDKVTGGGYQTGSVSISLPVSVPYASAPVKVDSLASKGLSGMMGGLGNSIPANQVAEVKDESSYEEPPTAQVAPDWFKKL